MCYKETPYHGKCGCYGKPQFVGEPCIRAAVNKALQSTGCWDVVDLGIKSTNTLCQGCVVAEELVSRSAGSSVQTFNSRSVGGSSASSICKGSSSASSLSGSSLSRASKTSSRSQDKVSLSGLVSHKLRLSDGSIDRSTTAYLAFHEVDGEVRIEGSHKKSYMDSVYR